MKNLKLFVAKCLGSEHRKLLALSLVLLMGSFAAARLPGWGQESPETEKTVTTASGLKYRILHHGNGPCVEKGKEIGLHGIGSFEDGKVFWNSRESVDPFYFVWGKDWVIKGCQEGTALMRVGDRFLFTMTPELGYGEKGKGSTIPPNAILIFDYEIISVADPKKSLADTLYRTIEEKGIAEALALYRQLKNEKNQEYNFREDQLNDIGYRLLKAGKTKEAIEIFSLNLDAFPSSANAYDSLAEAFTKDGQIQRAVENYQKSLELNPHNLNAAEMIKKLETKNE